MLLLPEQERDEIVNALAGITLPVGLAPKVLGIIKHLSTLKTKENDNVDTSKSDTSESTVS